MAITGIEYSLFYDMRAGGVLPERPSLIEFGEANWYGDVPIEQLDNDIAEFVSDAADADALRAELKRLAAVVESGSYKDELFDIAKIFYRVFVDPSDTVAVDLEGTAQAIKHDLNTPLDLDRTFELVLNFGTGEHVFSTYQFFKTIHDVTAPGGVMVHGMPFYGWIDHGFYTFQPTFYWDLAQANGYVPRALICATFDPLTSQQLRSREEIAALHKAGRVAQNSMLYAVLQMPETKKDFATPMQGYYAGTVSPQVREAWETMR